MRFSALSKKEKNRRHRHSQRDWHLVFAWLPKRVDKETIVWLEKYARKDVVELNRWEEPDAKNPEWRYKLVDDLLMDKLRGKE